MIGPSPVCNQDVSSHECCIRNDTLDHKTTDLRCDGRFRKERMDGAVRSQNTHFVDVIDGVSFEAGDVCFSVGVRNEHKNNKYVMWTFIGNR